MFRCFLVKFVFMICDVASKNVTRPDVVHYSHCVGVMGVTDTVVDFE